MTVLPDVIARYYSASAHSDIDGIVACFAVDATVTDDGRRYRGQAEIRGWRDSLASAFTFTTEITNVAELRAAEYVVSTHIEGDFPGGQVDLDQHFTLADGLITDLST